MDDDVLLEARVRQRLGRVCSHPGAISVWCRKGRVELRGPVLGHELPSLLRAIRRVRGVQDVQDLMQPHEQPGDVPGLQGGGHDATGGQADLFQRNWAPATRFMVGSTGALVLLHGLGQRGFLAKAFATVGAALLGRSVFNAPFRELAGVGRRRPGVHIHKSIQVNGPVEQVFALWQHFEDFPKFMTHVQEVRNIGDRRYLWKVTGPAGTRFEWEAVMTRFEPNRLIAWRSAPGATVGNAGVIHFRPGAHGGTLIDIQLSYSPPAGLLGHGIAHLLGADPKKQLDDDMIRFKSLVELGKARGHERVTREQVLNSPASATGVIGPR